MKAKMHRHKPAQSELGKLIDLVLDLEDQMRRLKARRARLRRNARTHMRDLKAGTQSVSRAVKCELGADDCSSQIFSLQLRKASIERHVARRYAN